MQEKTGGKVNALVTPEEVASASAIFLNAIYFKGMWSEPFEEENTISQIFTCRSGVKKMCQMMRQWGTFHYAQDTEIQVVRLAYGNGSAAMFVLLPAARMRITDFVTRLTVEKWTRWTESLARSEGYLAMPRFRLTYAADLNAALMSLGMGAAFDPLKADFSNMARRGVFISKVKHKAFVEVNEQGTEAGAATAVEMLRGGGSSRRQPFSMIVDRPFVCAIVDRNTKGLLFLGVINDPQEAEVA